MPAHRPVVAAFLMALLAVPAAGQDTADRVVRVSGEGTVSVAPDRATVRFGVVTRSPDPEEARSENAEASRQAMNAVRELGIAEGRIRLQSLQLQRRREFDPETRRTEERGFEATRTVVVEVDSLARVPALVARVVQQGANRLDGIEYGLTDRTPVRNRALERAATDAREKARRLVGALGAGLGPVRQIREQGLDFPQPAYRTSMGRAKTEAARAAPEPDAYAAGEIDVTARVEVVFELRPAGDGG
jgi:hypothetical protein